jgi:hypothetical protein
MMLPGTYALTIAIAAACIAIASLARPQSHRQSPAPEIEEGRVWLERKAAERARAFQLQQRFATAEFVK